MYHCTVCHNDVWRTVTWCRPRARGLRPCLSEHVWPACLPVCSSFLHHHDQIMICDVCGMSRRCAHTPGMSRMAPTATFTLSGARQAPMHDAKVDTVAACRRASALRLQCRPTLVSLAKGLICLSAHRSFPQCSWTKITSAVCYMAPARSSAAYQTHRTVH